MEWVLFMSITHLKEFETFNCVFVIKNEMFGLNIGVEKANALDLRPETVHILLFRVQDIDK